MNQRKEMALREFWILVSYFLVALRRALTVAWIRLNKFLSSSDWMVRPVTTYRHKVCLSPGFLACGWSSEALVDVLMLTVFVALKTRRVFYA